MNVSIVIIFLLPMFLGVVRSNEIAPVFTDVLDFFSKFREMKDDVYNLKKVIVNLHGNNWEDMTLAQAHDLCKSKGSRLATLDDLIVAYRKGFEDCRCGWSTNGVAYLISQYPKLGCNFGAGTVPCRGRSKWNAWCTLY